MKQFPVGQFFREACAAENIPVVIERVSTFGKDWQVDLAAGRRRFSICLDSRDGFMFLERIGAQFVAFDHGEQEPVYLSDQEVCSRAMALLKVALANPHFRGFNHKVI